MYRFDAPCSSPTPSRYCDRVVQALRNQPGIERWVVLDMEGVGSIDGTAVASLRRLVDDVGREGVEVIAVARANPLALDRLGRAGLLQPDGRSSCTPPSARRSERFARQSLSRRPVHGCPRMLANHIPLAGVSSCRVGRLDGRT